MSIFDYIRWNLDHLSCLNFFHFNLLKTAIEKQTFPHELNNA